MAQVGFIGMGNMGSAILEGLLKIYPGEELVFTAAHREKMEEVTARTGVPHGSSNADCASRCKYLILAVKPQYFETVFQEIEGELRPEQVIISLAPGITICSLKDRLGERKPNSQGGAGAEGYLRGLRQGGGSGGTADERGWLCQRQFPCFHLYDD